MNGRPKRTDEEPCDGLVPDRKLLGEFLDQHDENAFAQLVSRYCGLVLGVCRRVLRDEHSAEDAFQATFLVLARRASRIRNRASLAGWLYAVAYRTARRATAKRLALREEALRDDIMATDDILAQITSRYEQQLLDEELNRLPAKYREPLVLRYLMGKSNKQVASELGLGVGVVEGRLKRGKDRLRLRLAKRGINLTVGLAAVGASATAVQAATTDWLVAATVETAAAFRSGAPPAGDYSQSAIRLAEKELAMSTSTITMSTTSAVAAALVIAGLTLGPTGEAGQQPVHAQGPTMAATTRINPPAAWPTPGDHLPVQLAMAEKKEPDSEPEEILGLVPDESRQKDASSAMLNERREAMLRAKYGSIDMKSRSAAEQRILEALDGPTEMAFIEAPLMDIIDVLKDYHAIEIQLDQRALDDVGIPADCPITRNLKGLTLRSALSLLLRDLDLTFVVVDEVLLITTPEVADAMMETRVYSLYWLSDFEPEELAKVIQNTIACDTWRTDASPDETSSSSQPAASKVTRRAAIEALPGCLVITQSQHAHEEITDLLKQLDRYQTSARALREDSGD